MTDTFVTGPRVALPRSRNRRLRSAVVATLLVAVAGIAAALGTLWLSDAPAAVQWHYPTTIEELIEQGFVPKDSLGSVADETVRWPYPTSLDDLVERGYVPAGS